MRRLLLLLMAGLTGLAVLPVGASAAEGACSNEALRAELGSSALPECRAYELVSPTEKNGADVAAAPSRTRVATDGDAVQFVALGAFPGAQGTDAIGTEYIARRGADGWETHGITPPQAPPAFPIWSSMYVGNFSNDLNTGVFFALSSVTQGDPNVVNVPNLYLRDDLLSPGAGHYRLLSGCPACSLPLSAPPFEVVRPGLVTLAGASENFSHVIFESNANLLPGAEGSEAKLYEYADGVTRLVGVLPDSACGAPPCIASASVAGSGAIKRSSAAQELTSDAISRDGSRIIFTAAPFTGLPEVGASILSSGVAGALYLREDGVRSVQLNVSERTPADTPRPAYFVAATPDASKIFFATQEQMTNDDANGELDLYRYTVDASEGHHLTLISHRETLSTGSSDGEEAVGVSDDGEFIYFSGSSQLTEQRPVDGLPLYVWHQGQLRYIGSRQSGASGDVPWRVASVAVGLMTSQVRVTPNGKHLVFVTRNSKMAEAAGYDNNGSRCTTGGPCSEVYLYSYDSNTVVCVSCGSNGAPPAGDSAIASLNERDTTKFTTTQHLSHALSDDGNLFFDSPDSLVPQDSNGKYDVYEYFAATGALRLISSGQSSSDSHFEDATADGSDVFFVTGQQLVGADVDRNADLYDARVDGGIASQQSGPVVEECSGDLCQGSPAGTSALSFPSSLTFVGAGNVPGVTQASVVKPTPKAKPKRKAKAKKKARAKKRRAKKRRSRAGRARVSRKSHSAGR